VLDREYALMADNAQNARSVEALVCANTGAKNIAVRNAAALEYASIINSGPAAECVEMENPSANMIKSKVAVSRVWDLEYASIKDGKLIVLNVEVLRCANMASENTIVSRAWELVYASIERQGILVKTWSVLKSNLIVPKCECICL
jgi:hypothetical protein